MSKVKISYINKTIRIYNRNSIYSLCYIYTFKEFNQKLFKQFPKFIQKELIKQLLVATKNQKNILKTYNKFLYNLVFI